MKNSFKFLLILMILLNSTDIAYAANPGQNSWSTETMSSSILQPEIDPVKHQQLKAQIHLFRQALDEFGAKSPQQVVDLWAKSLGMRNGVLQYAVSCKELKGKIEKDWGKAEESFWIIGGSSPWLYKCEITKATRLDDSTYEVTLKYYWATSAGAGEPTSNILKIVKEKDIWCVKAVSE